jgi:hypothetical protein
VSVRRSLLALAILLAGCVTDVCGFRMISTLFASADDLIGR